MEATTDIHEHVLWTLADVAEYWRCSSFTAKRRLECVGAPAAVRPAGRKLWVREEITAFTEATRIFPRQIAGAAKLLATSHRARGPQRRRPA